MRPRDAGLRAAEGLFGSWGDRFVTAAIAVSTFGFLDLAILAPTRVYYAMAADRVFLPASPNPSALPDAVAGDHRAVGVGVRARALGHVRGADRHVVFADWIFFGLTVGTVLVFRRTVPLASRPAGGFRAPLSPLLPVLFAIVSAGVVASVVASNPMRSALGATLLLAGVPAYLYWRRRAPTPAEEAKGRGERE